jgi:hypothetical protein
VLNWEDCLNEKSAWDTLAWFAILVGLAGQLTNLGIVSWISNCVAKVLRSFSLSWPAAFGVLQASYFFIHYIFASQTAQVGALYSAFLAMHLAAGVPALMSALALAYNANLFGSLTHYSSGQSAVYFGGNCAFPPLLLNSTYFPSLLAIIPYLFRAWIYICAHNKIIIQMEPYNEMKAQAAAHRHEGNSLRVLLVRSSFYYKGFNK